MPAWCAGTWLAGQSLSAAPVVSIGPRGLSYLGQYVLGPIPMARCNISIYLSTG
jgi:hypothetical protein